MNEPFQYKANSTKLVQPNAKFPFCMFLTFKTEKPAGMASFELKLVSN